MNDSGRGDLYYLIFLFLYDKPQSNQTNESGVTIPTIHSSGKCDTDLFVTDLFVRWKTRDLN